MAKKGKVLYDNLAIAATITPSTTLTGLSGDSVADWQLYTYWQGTHATQNIIEFDYGSLVDVDCFCLFGHDLHNYSGTVKFQWSNDGSTGWTDLIGTVTPADSSPVFKSFTSVNKRYFRAVFDTTGGAPIISCVAFGEYLEMENGWRTGYRPIGMLKNVQRKTNMSQGGIPLGYSTTRKAVSGTISQRNASESWVRNSWQPFVEAAQLHPFFFSWDETSHPLEAVYAWYAERKEPAASYSSRTALMRVEMKVEALHEL